MIYDKYGKRKYLTLEELRSFLSASRLLEAETESFCLALVHTGARISEILALTPDQVDLDAGVVVIQSLKKRRTDHFRAIPVTSGLLSIARQSG